MDELAGLTGEARKRALDRFHLLQPHLENDRPLKEVAAAAGIPFRTAQRWVSLYRQFRLAGLARRKRTDTGEHREISAKLKAAGRVACSTKSPLRTLGRGESRLKPESYTTQSRFGSFTYKRFTVPQEVHRSAKRASLLSLPRTIRKSASFSLCRGGRDVRHPDHQKQKQ